MNEIKFKIPGNPIAKARARSGPGGFYTPKRTAKYEQQVAQHAQIAMVGRSVFDEPIDVNIEAVFPIPKSWPKDKSHACYHEVTPDLDNVVKAVLDGFQSIVVSDDKLVASLTARKIRRNVKTGWVDVIVRPCTPFERLEPANE